MSFIIIPMGNGIITHRNIDEDDINLSDSAEIYHDKDAFEDRLSDFDG
jgi:hypothetical protein